MHLICTIFVIISQLLDLLLQNRGKSDLVMSLTSFIHSNSVK